MWLVLCAIQSIYLFAASDALFNASNGLELRRQTGKNCVLPEYPTSGSWSLFFNSDFKPGMSVNEGSIILLDCEPGYTLNGTKSMTCEDGRWTPKMGKCLATATHNGTVSRTPEPTTNVSDGCLLPNYPSHGQWIIVALNTSISKPGMQVPQSTVLRMTCNKGFKLVGESLSVCFKDGTWSNTGAKCLRTCLSLRSTETTKVICSYQNRELEDCNLPVSGTIARIECSPFHETLQNPLNLCSDGSWNYPKSECTPVCGRKRAEAQPLIIGGRITEKGSYPWHVAIYNRSTEEFICGGTLISPRLVLTSASCVTDSEGELEPKENYVVAAGKIYRKYDHPIDSDSVQFSTLDSIHIPSTYRGEVQNFYSDIAVLVVSTSFKISKLIQPVCVDWSLSYNLPIPNSLGYVAGWGYTEENRAPSQQLKELKIPIVDSATCFKNSPGNFLHYLTRDKICAGYLNSSFSICRGDSGSGLFVEHQNRNYIVGVASVAPISRDGGCSSQHYAAYTKVNDYTDLIAKTDLEVRSKETNNTKETDCILPQHPKNGQFVNAPRDSVSSGFIIEITCNATYVLQGAKFLKCVDGEWNSTIGSCAAPCPPIASSRSMQVYCSSGNNNISCSNAIHGTVATFECNPFYENLDLSGNPFRTCQDGQWKPEVPSCVPMCGVKPETEEGKNYNPWNVAVYQVDGQKRNFKCAGTLINERIVLTSAQCISDDLGIKFSPKNYIIIAGKKENEVEDISTHKEYGGKVRRYWADIALLITKKPFSMSKDVQLACIDWKQAFPDDFAKFKGFIPATSQTDTEIAIIDPNECYLQLSLNSSYLTFDKICSRVINLEAPKCKIINRGVGLVTKSRYDNRYYLVGIASDFFPSNCDAENYILFTQVSKHVSSFIAEKNKLYTPVNTPYFQSFCGVKSVQAQTLIVGGKNVSKSEYPWQVALYKTKPNGKKMFICGGALINQRIILTAAHCVTKIRGTKLPLDGFTVAAGKYYREFDHEEEDEPQFSALIDIIVPPPFEGELQNYVGDIALLISEKSFALSKHVQPVCVDWEGKYENHLLKNSVTGYVSGWGFTKHNRNPSEILKDLEVQYVDRDRCRKDLPQDYDVFLTFDKICSGFLNRSASVCKGDSGGGLVFRNEIDGRYYIFGVVSLSPQAPSGGCNIQTYSLYTRVSYYLKDFILQKAQLYWR